MIFEKAKKKKKKKKKNLLHSIVLDSPEILLTRVSMKIKGVLCSRCLSEASFVIIVVIDNDLYLTNRAHYKHPIILAMSIFPKKNFLRTVYGPADPPPSFK